MNWIHASALAGLAAIGIPIAIHLMRNRQTRVIELGSLRFLHEALRETQARRRLRELLLLLARIAAVCLLVFLFARPLLKVDNAASVQSALLLIDCSSSMDGTALGRSNRELAVEAAERTLRELGPGPTVLIAAYADTVMPVSSLVELPTGRGEANHAAAIRWARSRLAELPGDRQRIYWFTDMQTAARAATEPPQPAMGAPVELVPLSLPGEWNAAVQDAALLTRAVGGSATMAVQVARLGQLPADVELTAVVELGGREVVKAAVPPDGRTRLEIPADAITGSWLTGSVRLRSSLADAWPADDVRHFAWPVTRQVPVLVVDGAPGPDRFGDASYFLIHALSLSQHNGGSPAYAVRRAALAPPADLSGFGIIVLVNVADLAPPARTALRSFVENGGRLLYCLGSRCTPAEYAALQAAGIFPGTLGLRDLTLPRAIADWDRDHPALRVFDGGTAGDLARLPVVDHFSFAPAEGTAPLATLRDGTPVLATAPVGKGSITVFTNPVDRSFCDLPVSRLYVPFLHELFGWLAGSETRPAPPVEVCSLADDRLPGIHGEPPAAVVVIPDEESRPAALAESAFTARFGVPPAKSGPPDDLLTLPADRQRENELWVWCAVALLVVAMMENFLADRSRA